VLVEILELWIRAHMGPVTGYDIPPHNGVPLHALHRIMALRTCAEEKGSVAQYMEKVRSSNVPPAFAECIKHSKKGAKGQGNDPPDE
jgi:hypothetical protein